MRTIHRCSLVEGWTITSTETGTRRPACNGYAWAGLTNGAQTDADIVDAYHAAGYDIAGVSDYQRISDPALSPIAEYEHGYNIRKRHQLAIGAKGVVWMDFLFWQGLNQKQYILDRLRATAALVSINHPARLEGYTVDDMLTGTIAPAPNA